ncbi:MAG: site-specific DNA-methyltransferase [Dehalococcoidia bacterium]|jgi:DNA modification methylase|nr:MAG: site-specific DNA-methyltransferase [Dehalococcoidia bacterium]
MTIDTFSALEVDKIIQGDSLTVLRSLPDSCINFIFTSPPYADNRKKTYKGIPIKEYVTWFLPISSELKRVLKADGTFILNIKERTEDGERQTYVLELILEMRKQGWLWTEEYIWHKKNCYPGRWPNRFRDAWERCLQFNKQKNFKMYQEAVMVPIGDWSKKRLAKLSETDRIRDVSKVGSGFGKNVSNWLGKRFVYPTNVLHLSTECANRGHSASFPYSLPAWFIRLFTQEEDIVLDPFIGSGTSAIACLDLNRHYVGIEAMESYTNLARESVNNWKAGHNGHSKKLI